MAADQPIRRRKGHKKSRSGCANCKLRRVKCDETKPECNKCQEFQVACSYDSKADLDCYGTGSFQVTSLRPVLSTNQTVLSMIHENHVSILPPLQRQKAYRFNTSDLDTLARFQHRTVHTIGTPEISKILQHELIRYACKDPPLMHAILTITLAHDRVDISPFVQPSLREMYHMNQSIQAVSSALRNPDSPFVSNTIWATATVMGAVSFCTMEGDSPEKLWPMKDMDLAWLKMSEGKALVHKMMASTDVDSPAQKLATIHYASNLASTLPFEDLAVLPPRFLEVFGISETTGTGNPYYTAICFLAQLAPLEANQTNILKFTNFITRLDPGFRTVLLIKDPRALLIIAWWWAMCSTFKQWWHLTRSRLEGQAVCLYLAKYHGDKEYIQEFLPYAQAGCGLLDSPSLNLDFDGLKLGSSSSSEAAVV